MNWHVYFLYSKKDKRTYVGSTNDLQRRLKNHNDGLVLSTKNRRPLILFYSEQCENEKAARLKEKYYKCCSGRKKMKIIFENSEVG